MSDVYYEPPPPPPPPAPEPSGGGSMVSWEPPASSPSEGSSASSSPEPSGSSSYSSPEPSGTSERPSEPPPQESEAQLTNQTQRAREEEPEEPQREERPAVQRTEAPGDSQDKPTPPQDESTGNVNKNPAEAVTEEFKPPEAAATPAPQGEDQGAGQYDPEKGQTPSGAAAYLQGADAMPPNYSNMINQKVDPENMMSPMDRSIMAIDHLAKNYGPHGMDLASEYMAGLQKTATVWQAHGAGAAAQGDWAKAAHYATQAFNQVPDGVSVAFEPTTTGAVMKIGADDPQLKPTNIMLGGQEMTKLLRGNIFDGSMLAGVGHVVDQARGANMSSPFAPDQSPPGEHETYGGGKNRLTAPAGFNDPWGDIKPDRSHDPVQPDLQKDMTEGGVDQTAQPKNVAMTDEFSAPGAPGEAAKKPAPGDGENVWGHGREWQQEDAEGHGGYAGVNGKDIIDSNTTHTSQGPSGQQVGGLPVDWKQNVRDNGVSQEGGKPLGEADMKRMENTYGGMSGKGAVEKDGKVILSQEDQGRMRAAGYTEHGINSIETDAAIKADHAKNGYQPVDKLSGGAKPKEERFYPQVNAMGDVTGYGTDPQAGTQYKAPPQHEGVGFSGNMAKAPRGEPDNYTPPVVPNVPQKGKDEDVPTSTIPEPTSGSTTVPKGGEPREDGSAKGDVGRGSSGVHGPRAPRPVSHEENVSRPHFIGGKLSVGGQTYDFGSGGHGNGSIPYGTHTIQGYTSAADRAATGHKFNHDAFVLSDSKDPKTGGTRQAMLIHEQTNSDMGKSGSGHSLGSAGCVAIPHSQWPSFKENLRNQLASGGKVQLYVGPDGAQIISSKGGAQPRGESAADFKQRVGRDRNPDGMDDPSPSRKTREGSPMEPPEYADGVKGRPTLNTDTMKLEDSMHPPGHTGRYMMSPYDGWHKAPELKSDSWAPNDPRRNKASGAWVTGTEPSGYQNSGTQYKPQYLGKPAGGSPVGEASFPQGGNRLRSYSEPEAGTEKGDKLSAPAKERGRYRDEDDNESYSPPQTKPSRLPDTRTDKAPTGGAGELPAPKQTPDNSLYFNKASTPQQMQRPDTAPDKPVHVRDGMTGQGEKQYPNGTINPRRVPDGQEEEAPAPRAAPKAEAPEAAPKAAAPKKDDGIVSKAEEAVKSGLGWLYDHTIGGGDKAAAKGKEAPEAAPRTEAPGPRQAPTQNAPPGIHEFAKNFWKNRDVASEADNAKFDKLLQDHFGMSAREYGNMPRTGAGHTADPELTKLRRDQFGQHKDEFEYRKQIDDRRLNYQQQHDNQASSDRRYVADKGAKSHTDSAAISADAHLKAARMAARARKAAAIWEFYAKQNQAKAMKRAAALKAGAEEAASRNAASRHRGR